MIEQILQAVAHANALSAEAVGNTSILSDPWFRTAFAFAFGAIVSLFGVGLAAWMNLLVASKQVKARKGEITFEQLLKRLNALELLVIKLRYGSPLNTEEKWSFVQHANNSPDTIKQLGLKVHNKILNGRIEPTDDDLGALHAEITDLHTKWLPEDAK